MGGAGSRCLGILDAVGDVLERHPEKFLTRVRWEVAPNICAALQVRGRGRDGTVGPAGAVEEIQADHEEGILWEARAEAEHVLAAKGRRAPGVEGAVVRAQDGGGVVRALVSTGSVGRA